MLKLPTFRMPNACARAPRRRSSSHVAPCPAITAQNPKSVSHSSPGRISNRSKLVISAHGSVMRSAMIDRVVKSDARSHPMHLTP